MATGFKELVLLPALMEPGPMDVGLTRSEAKAVIAAVFDSIKDALLRHEQVELPIGTFTVEQNPEERRAWKFGKVTTLYAHRYQVKFLPSAELNLATAAAPTSPPGPKRKKEIVKSELTISTELIVDFIRKNVLGGNVTLFFNELRAGLHHARSVQTRSATVPRNPSAGRDAHHRGMCARENAGRSLGSPLRLSRMVRPMDSTRHTTSSLATGYARGQENLGGAAIGLRRSGLFFLQLASVPQSTPACGGCRPREASQAQSAFTGTNPMQCCQPCWRSTML